MTISITRIASADQIAGPIAEDVFDHEVTADRLAAYLAEPQHMLVLAFDGETVVGQCRGLRLLHPDQGAALYIDNLGVAPSHHRRGIGRSLVVELMAWGRERGCVEAWVLTEPDNEPARALYEGFKGTPVETPVLYHYDL